MYQSAHDLIDDLQDKSDSHPRWMAILFVIFRVVALVSGALWLLATA